MELYLKEVKGLCPTLGTLTLGSSTRKISTQNIWVWKSMGIKTRRPTELQEMELPHLKGLYTNLLTLKSSAKTIGWKVFRP